MTAYWPPPRNATCPKCGAEPGKNCRTLKTRRITDTHAARFDAAYGRHITTEHDHHDEGAA